MKGKVTVLMFHRVTDKFFDVSLLIKKETFEECMKYITQSCSVISMDFLSQNIDKWENISDDSYVITFDDGWIDFHDTAYPILSRLKIPATVYLTTGFVSSRCSYWQERLYNLLTPILANKKMFLEKDNIIFVPEINLKLKGLISKSDGKPVIFKFIDYLKGFTQDIISNTISELEESLKEHSIIIGEDRDRLFVNWDEVNNFNHPDITFGSHTITHPILTNEQTDVIEDEICRSKEIMEKETGREAIHFCYPNGNYNDSVKKIASGSYKSACTTNAGFVSKNSDIYALNRIGINEEMVTDWSGNFSKYVFTLSLFLETIRK